MQSRSARLVHAALQKSTQYETHPSTSGFQNDSTPALVQDHNSESDTTRVSDFDSDDSIFDKNYEPPKKCGSNILAEDSESESDSIPCSQQNLERTVIMDSSDETNAETTITDNNIELTKTGAIRKRKKYTINAKDRKKNKKDSKIMNKYWVKVGCSENICKKKCSTHFSEERRKVINRNFWKMSWTEQKCFFLSNTSQTKPARPKKRTDDQIEGKEYIRSKTVSYFLVNENCDKVQVCRTFFLTTLGYNQTNNKAVRNILDSYYKKQGPQTITDGRGHHENPRKIDSTKIKEHIMSFCPVVSHYRREHAPNRKYLPSDLNIRMMYDHFCEKEPSIKVSYCLYRKIVKELNISFAKLGHEQCEVCEKFIIHNPNQEIRHRNCEECKKYEIHHERYISARKKYEEDADNQTQKRSDPDTIYFAVDLEKVIMLPRMEEFKTVMFCPRIIVFNQSFVPIGDKKMHETGKTFASVWHEGVSGRKKEDIISCFRAFFLENRDLKHIVLWLDNCAAQNKNWTLYSYMVHLVNSPEVSFETITLRYLEVGHTFMAADEFHHRVELSLKKAKRVYDFEDFTKAVSDTGPNTKVKNMTVQDFYDFEDCSSLYKLQHSRPRAYMNSMCETVFRRGFTSLLYKINHSTENQLELDFLKNKNIKNGTPPPRQKLVERGVTSIRKSAILAKLGPLMPSNRRVFWETLAVNDNSADLTQTYED